MIGRFLKCNENYNYKYLGKVLETRSLKGRGGRNSHKVNVVVQVQNSTLNLLTKHLYIIFLLLPNTNQFRLS